MASSICTELQQGTGAFQRPRELLPVYVSDPQSPRPDEVDRLVSDLEAHQIELEVHIQALQTTQRQLEAYRDRYVDLYDFAPLGYVTLDDEGYIQEMNLAGASLLGSQLADLVGYPFADYVVAPDRAAFLEHIRKCCGQRQEVTSELELITKDGRLVAVQLHSVSIVAPEHEGVFCKTAITDITERKRTEHAIRLNEARLEAVLQLSHMTEASLQEITDFALEQAVALTKSKLGYLAFMNEDETVLAVHSWPKDAEVGRADSEEPSGDSLKTTCVWREAASQGKPIVANDCAASNRLKTGLPQNNVDLDRCMDVPILDGQRVVIVARVGNKEEDYDESDVRQLTLLMEGLWSLIRRQQVQAQLQQHREHLEQLVEERTEALRKNQEQYRSLIEACPDAVVMSDFSGTVLLASPQTWTLLGLSDSDELVGKSVFSYVIESDRQRLAANMCQVTEAGLRRNTEYTALRKDGTTVPAEASSVVIRDRQGRPMALMAVIRDVTVRKQSEEALREERKTLCHLLQANDQERQTIAYEIHDELSQRLAGAIMQFQTFESLKDTKPRLAMKAYREGMALVQQGHSETRRLIAGVRPPILDQSGVVAAIAHLVNEQGPPHGPTIEYRNQVQFGRLNPTLENAIYRIVQEGVTNACRHSKSEKVRVSLVQRDNHIQIAIRDWGVGFDVKAVRENRFGLEGMRQRTKSLGGKCNIRSAPGKGARIAVELPLLESDTLQNSATTESTTR